MESAQVHKCEPLPPGLYMLSCGPSLLHIPTRRKILADTGKLLAAFCIGACATIAGTLVAFKILPLTTLGADGWKVGLGQAVSKVGLRDSVPAASI